MFALLSAPVRRTACCAVLMVAAVSAALPSPASAIEMFTFYGDGSRVGLPNLEVPVEAYPGIPLRSDRIRARRRAMQAGPGSTVRLGPTGLPTRPGGVTIRAMPTNQMPASQIPTNQIPGRQIPATRMPATKMPAAQPEVVQPPVPEAP